MDMQDSSTNGVPCDKPVCSYYTMEALVCLAFPLSLKVHVDLQCLSMYYHRDPPDDAVGDYFQNIQAAMEEYGLSFGSNDEKSRIYCRCHELMNGLLYHSEGIDSIRNEDKVVGIEESHSGCLILAIGYYTIGYVTNELGYCVSCQRSSYISKETLMGWQEPGWTTPQTAAPCYQVWGDADRFCGELAAREGSAALAWKLNLSRPQ
ncbi:hypothetical protein LSH36_167g01005 [Paralvinella palmiformis]|uniref:Uncharacterized protein n=1 Tax=Paralvinella palmiformis TaxID=53620 RepID=A0AAD9N846_9ANNE|nr:hypothetical protein LSH36_167g01005 [Paralvinella palmiformis]